jgi:zinc protease
MQYPELKDVKIGHAHFALRMAIRELDNMVRNGLSEKDFEETRKFLRSYIKLYIASPEERLGYLMDSKFYGRNNFIRETDSLLANLTVDDVNKAVKKYLQPDNMCITIVTDSSESETLAESLRNNTDSPMSYSNAVREGLSKSILEEDAKVENFPLNIKSVKIVDSEDTFK